MKKYIKLFIISVLLGYSFSSCLNEDGIFEENPTQGIVELSLPARSTSTPYGVKSTTVEVKDEFDLPITINYTGVNGTPSDTQITIEIVNEILDVYDDSGSTVGLPSDFYELPSSNVVTIPKGQKTATYTIKLKPKLFDLSQSYALGIKIANTTTGTISGNYSTGVYTLPVKSPWEGTYDVTYYWYQRGSATANLTETASGIQVSTAGAGIVEVEGVGNYFGGVTYYAFKADGTVGVTGTYATQLVSSSYDLDNLTFVVDYYFYSTSYHLKETYVRTGD